MLTFTDLEQSVIDAICDAQRDTLAGLTEFMSSAEVLSRENTGHGFYTYFRAAPLDPHCVWPHPISGPNAKMIGLGEDALMGFLLWCSTGEPSVLEGFQYGDVTGETVDLKTFDLTTLSFSQLQSD